MPTLTECAVGEFLKDRRSDAGVNEKDFQATESKYPGSVFCDTESQIAKLVTEYVEMLEEVSNAR